MVKICPKCGTTNSADEFWCINCNTKLTETKQIHTAKEPDMIEKLQKDQQIKGIHVPEKNKTQQKKRKLSLKSIFILIIAVVLILSILAFLLKEDDSKKFIGNWNLEYTQYENRIEYVNGTQCLTFNEDKTVMKGSTKIGDWEIDLFGKFIFTYDFSESWEGPWHNIIEGVPIQDKFDYEFSNSNNQLELRSVDEPMPYTMVFSKKIS